MISLYRVTARVRQYVMHFAIGCVWIVDRAAMHANGILFHIACRFCGWRNLRQMPSRSTVHAGAVGVVVDRDLSFSRLTICTTLSQIAPDVQFAFALFRCVAVVAV